MAASEWEIRTKFKALEPVMDERLKRLWAGAEADAYGDGGIAAVERATGMSRTTIRGGRDELRAGARPEDVVHVRRPGGGRPRLEETSPHLVEVLESLVDPVTRGDPESPLRWTSKSTRKLSRELLAQGLRVSPQKVGQLLYASGYSLQATHKTTEGASHPDRNAQFEFINERVEDHHARGAPVISVDTKKKENIGNFSNDGREWEPQQRPRRTQTHDFRAEGEPKAAPYGVYDPTRNEGWVNVGISHDTAPFAVASLRGWWRKMGRERYPAAKTLLITADAGGSNGYRTRLWKVELQNLADEIGLAIRVCHFPPGTSKWNKIEHRLFSFISKNWRGQPLDSLATIVNLISHTTTKGGLYVEASLDYANYEKGIEVTDVEMEKLHLKRDKFHGEWNYSLLPRQK